MDSPLWIGETVANFNFSIKLPVWNEWLNMLLRAVDIGIVPIFINLIGRSEAVLSERDCISWAISLGVVGDRKKLFLFGIGKNSVWQWPRSVILPLRVGPIFVKKVLNLLATSFWSEIIWLFSNKFIFESVFLSLDNSLFIPSQVFFILFLSWRN